MSSNCAPLLFLPETDSTNTYVVKHFAELPDGMLICAGRQTAGRGRRGRVWFSPEGVNIYATLVVKTPGKPFLAGAVVGLAGLRLARELAPDAASFLKWPNDIYLGTRKLAGILCEGAGVHNGTLTGIAAGIGINVNQEQSALDALDRPAVSLAAAADRTWDLNEVRAHFAELVAEVSVQRTARAAPDPHVHSARGIFPPGDPAEKRTGRSLPGCAGKTLRGFDAGKCKGKKVSRDEIEDAIYSHLENAEDDSDEEMVNEVLKSFPGVEFEILPCSHIVVD